MRAAACALCFELRCARPLFSVSGINFGTIAPVQPIQHSPYPLYFFEICTSKASLLRNPPLQATLLLIQKYIGAELWHAVKYAVQEFDGEVALKSGTPSYHKTKPIV